MNIEELFSDEFGRLRQALMKYGRSRFPTLHDQLEDVVNSSLTDLWGYLRDNSTRHGMTPDELSRLAFTIFKRRAVDVFRGPASKWAMSADAPSEEVAADEQSEKRILMKGVLRITVAELSKLSREDRMLLAIAADLSTSPQRPMNARDRQRLHRLRARLAAAIRAELGEEVANLIREDV